MDEFKFRVWDEEYKKYQTSIIFDNEQQKAFVRVGDTLSSVETSIDKMEQCTGIRDKNAKLIYVGDIINWSGKGWGIEIGKAEMAELWLEEAAGEPEDYEIVGNIHANPDAFERGKK